MAADHLSRLESSKSRDIREGKIGDSFPHEMLMFVRAQDEGYPWFADFANYLSTGKLPDRIPYQQKKKFFADLKFYIWEDPYLFRIGADQIVRRCVTAPETRSILEHCHSGWLAATTGELTLLSGCLMWGSIVPPSLRTPTSLSVVAMLANEPATSRLGMRCPRTPFRWLNFSTYGVLISWDLSPHHEGIVTSL